MYQPPRPRGTSPQNSPDLAMVPPPPPPPPPLFSVHTPPRYRRASDELAMSNTNPRAKISRLSASSTSSYVNTDGHVDPFPISNLEHNAKIAAEIYSLTPPLECKGTRALGECGVAAEAQLKEDMSSSCFCCWASRERVLRRRWGSWRPGKEIVQQTCAKRRQRSWDRGCTRLQGWLLRRPLCEQIVHSLLELDVHF